MPDDQQDKRASMLPQVEKVLQSPELTGAMVEYRRDVVVRMVRRVIGSLRGDVSSGKMKTPTDIDDVAKLVVEKLHELDNISPRRVINATGIILHTNLGRSILSASARNAVLEAASTYCDLEVDLASGERTRRDIHLERLLLTLFESEAATVVNNNAAAVMLALNTLAEGREVITSRGELIEIGGSFRVPDVVAKSGAILREVGTTNKVHPSDYESAINENTALILKTHTSNYRIVGFHDEVETRELVEIGKRFDIPVVVDLGSGYIMPASGEGIDEPDIASMLSANPAVVTFSGDKLLWGPQAGIAVGQGKYIEAMRRNPLWRVMRIDKLTSAALYATLLEHIKGHASVDQGEMSWLMGRTIDQLSALADDLAMKLRKVKPGWLIDIGNAPGSFGGGSVPGQELESRVIIITPDNMQPSKLDHAMRNSEPRVLGYFLKGQYVINVLTLLPGDSDNIVIKIAGIT